MRHGNLFFRKKSHLSQRPDANTCIFQAVQEVEHRLVGHRNVLETLVILCPRAVLLLRLSQPLVDVGISAMHLELSVAAVIINIGLEHVVPKIIGDVAQPAIEYHATVHIFVDNMTTKVTQTNLSHRNKCRMMKLKPPFKTSSPK